MRDVTSGNSSQPGSKYENCRFTYDGYGRRITKNYTYDNNVSSTSDYSYKYDTTYTYDESGRLIRESLAERMTYSGGGTITREFIYLYDESGIIGVLYGADMDSLQPYYFRKNAQGDVIAIYDANGTRKAEYAYDSWGNCSIIYGKSHDLARRNPIRYRGYYYDRETNLYYLNARYYNPEWRRFISPDDTAYLDPETPNGLNLYAYCYNDPVNFVDPSGNLGFWIATLIGAGILGLAGIGATAYSDYIDDGEIFNGSSSAEAYIGNTLVATSIGALCGGLIFTFGSTITSFLGSSFSFALPSLGALSTGGALAIAGGVTVTVTGAQIVGGAVGISVFGFSLGADRYKRKNVGSNTSQNEFIEHLQKKYNINDKMRRRLHDRITKRGYSNKKVEEILRKMLGLD